MPGLSLIAARSENNVIGQGADIPWRVQGEQKLFQSITTGGVLVMGRKTFESIGKPLPGRTTIIVTRNPAYQADGCLLATSLDDALNQAAQQCTGVYIAGGGEIYAQAINLADCIHLTTIHTTVAGDVFFPKIPEGDFRLVEEKKFSSNLDYTYQRYDRT